VIIQYSMRVVFIYACVDGEIKGEKVGETVERGRVFFVMIQEEGKRH
jgi:hypothetical protein